MQQDNSGVRPGLDAAALPAEIRFLLNIVAAGLGGVPPHPEPVLTDSGAGLDWASFLACVRHHRVAPLMSPALAPGLGMPDEWRRTLAETMRQAAVQSMHMTGELACIARCFAEGGVEVLALKGAALSVLLYGDPLRRLGRDIDLLVPVRAEAEARRLLMRLGYGTTDGDVTLCQNAVSLRHARHGTTVELHTRLAEDERLLSTAALRPFDTAVTVDIAGVPVATLAPDTALAYAAFHGAHHHWYRLHWLSDIGAATRCPAVDWRQVAEIARRTGTQRQLGFAAGLSEGLLGLALEGLPAPRRRDLAAIRRAEAITPAVLALPPINGYDMVRRVGRMRILGAELAIQSRPGARWAQLLARLQPTVTDHAALRLPRSLSFLYYVVRLVRVLRVGLLPWLRGRS